MAGSVYNAPMFLKASSPKRLQEAMLANNLKHGKEFSYYDIQFAQGAWYAWFRANQKDLVMKKLGKAVKSQSESLSVEVALGQGGKPNGQ